MTLIKIGPGLHKIYGLPSNHPEYEKILNDVIAFNRQYWKTMGVHERINLKSAYHLTNSTAGRFTPTIFHILHEINMVFCEQPYNLIV